MTRNGKIARLPCHIREELNQRLQNGEQAIKLVEWLNSLPEVKKILERDFGGRPINEQNLSDWKAGGFQDWRAEQQSRVEKQIWEAAQNMYGFGYEVAEENDGRLAQGLAAIVAAHYAALLQNWNGEITDQFLAKLKGLRCLSREIDRLQRSEQGAERTKIEGQRLDLQRFKADRRLESQSIQSLLNSSLFKFDSPHNPPSKAAGAPAEGENSPGPNSPPNQGESG